MFPLDRGDAWKEYRSNVLNMCSIVAMLARKVVVRGAAWKVNISMLIYVWSIEALLGRGVDNDVTYTVAIGASWTFNVHTYSRGAIWT